MDHLGWRMWNEAKYFDGQFSLFGFNAQEECTSKQMAKFWQGKEMHSGALVGETRKNKKKIK